jgi:steroid delta-isomerase-like uncharacterized protein
VDSKVSGELAGFLARYDEAWERRDVDAIMALHTSDSVFEDGNRREEARGEAVRAGLRSVFETWPDLVFTTRRQEVRDGLVVVEWTATATHTEPIRSRGRTAEPSGARVEWSGVDILRLEDGLVKRKTYYMDTLSMLRKIGLA